MDIPHFLIHSLVDGRLDFFHVRDIINNTAINISVQA